MEDVGVETHFEQSGAAVGGGQFEVVVETWETEAAPLEIASVGITNVLELGLRQYFKSRAMKNNTAATAPKPAPLSAIPAICDPAAITCCNEVCTTTSNGGNCIPTTVRINCSSPPGSTAGHKSFALLTTLPQSYRLRFCSDPVDIGAHESATALTLRIDAIASASSVGSGKMTSPEVSPLAFVVAVEKGIELTYSVDAYQIRPIFPARETYPVAGTLPPVVVVNPPVVVPFIAPAPFIGAVTGKASSLAVTNTTDAEY